MAEPYYDDGTVSLFHGDCREVTEWLEADVLVTDPPYGIGWSKGQNNAAGSVRHAGIANDESTATRDAALALWGAEKPGLVFGTWAAPAPAERRHTLVWRKPVDAGVVGSTTGFRRDTELVFLVGAWPQRNSQWSSVLTTGGSIHNYLRPSLGHPHAKPVGLLADLLERCPVGVVADPFCGSGSTLVAAKRLGRRAIGVEVDERYCEIAARRCAQGAFDFGAAS